MRLHLLPPALSALVLAATAAPCAAAWVRIADTDQSAFYLDTAISPKVGDNVMVWLLRDHHARRIGAGGPYLSSRDQIEVNCRTRRVRRIYSSDHPAPMGAGRFVHSEHGPMSWNDASPRTVMGRVVDVACADAKGAP